MTSEVNNIATMSTINRASATEAMPSQEVSASNAISAMNAETMNTSPWAKFTIPIMPNTIV